MYETLTPRGYRDQARTLPFSMGYHFGRASHYLPSGYVAASRSCSDRRQVSRRLFCEFKAAKRFGAGRQRRTVSFEQENTASVCNAMEKRYGNHRKRTEAVSPDSHSARHYRGVQQCE